MGMQGSCRRRNSNQTFTPCVRKQAFNYKLETDLFRIVACVVAAILNDVDHFTSHTLENGSHLTGKAFILLANDFIALRLEGIFMISAASWKSSLSISQ